MVNNARAQDKKMFSFDCYGDYAAIHPPGPRPPDHRLKTMNPGPKTTREKIKPPI